MAAPVIRFVSLGQVPANGSMPGWILADQVVVDGQLRLGTTGAWTADKDAPLSVAGGAIKFGTLFGGSRAGDVEVYRTGPALTPGDYTIEVRVKDAGERWSDPFPVTIEVYEDLTPAGFSTVESFPVVPHGSSATHAFISAVTSNGTASTTANVVYKGTTYTAPTVGAGSWVWIAMTDGAADVLWHTWVHGISSRLACLDPETGALLFLGAAGTVPVRLYDVNGDFTDVTLPPTAASFLPVGRLNADGTWAWVKTIDASAAISIGNAEVGPWCWVLLTSATALYDGAGITPSGTQMWVVSVDPDTGAPVFSRITSGDLAYSGGKARIARADDGAVAVITRCGTNRTTVSVTFAGATITARKMFLAVLDADGSLRWAASNTGGGGAGLFLYGLSIDEAGVSATFGLSFGSTSASSIDIGTGSQSVFNTAQCVGRWDASGTPQWLYVSPRTAASGNWENLAGAGGNALSPAVDGYQTTAIRIAQTTFTLGALTLPGPGLYLAKFATIDGSWQWAARAVNTTANVPNTAAVVGDKFGNMYITLSRPSTASNTGTLTDADGGTTSISGWTTASTQVFTSLDPDGNWASASLPGGTATELGAPISADWAVSQTEEVPFTATFTGTDGRTPPPTSPTYVLEVFDEATGTWVAPDLTTPLVLASNDWGRGQLFITQPFDPTILEASATFVPDTDFAISPADFVGQLRLHFRWRDGGTTSAVSRYQAIFENVIDAPQDFAGAMPDIDEDEVSIGTFTWTDPDRIGSYTLQLSPQTQAPEGWDEETQGDFRTTTGTTVTVVEDSVAVGTATVLNINGTTRSAQVRFTPIAHWHGSPSFALRVSNGGAWSPWVNTTVTVTPVPDAPSAVIGDAPSFDEDNSATFTLSWTDPDNLDGDFTADSGYELELGLTTSGPWTTTGTIAVPGATITVLEYSTTDLSASLRVDGDANYYGEYAFAARVHDTGDDLRGPARLLTSSINSVPDTPARVTPSRMPAARHNQTVEQTFSTFDPDPEDVDWTFTMSAAPTGPWTGTLTITGVGTLDVLDADLTDQQATVRLTQPEGGATLNRYSFYIRATDSSGRSSVPTKVIGYISDPLFQGFLQRLDRTQTAATLVRLVPLLGLTRATVTDALAGPGSLELTASAAELRRRAEELNIHPSALLEPGSVEVVISLGAEPLWVGPISEVRWDAGQELVDISARGLLSYLDTRVLASETTYTAEDLSAIVADLVTDTQTLDYGSLGIEDGTVPAGVNGTLVFEAGTRISDALRDVGEIPGAPEVWVDPERTLRAATTRGSDRRSSVRITSGLVEVASWSSRDDDIVTAATVIAPDNGNGPSSGSYADTAAMAVYGRIERVYEAEHLLTNAACAALAEQIVRAHAARAEAIKVRMTLDPTRPVSARSLGVGDVVTVDLRDPQLGQVLGAYRIVNRVVELAQSSSDAVTVTLDLEPARWVNGVLVGSRTRHVPEVMVRLQEVDVRTR